MTRAELVDVAATAHAKHWNAHPGDTTGAMTAALAAIEAAGWVVVPNADDARRAAEWVEAEFWKKLDQQSRDAKDASDE